MSPLILIAVVVAVVYALTWVVRFISDGNFLVSRFKLGNCIVAGHKGSGKDLLFSYVINRRKKEGHYSNVRYNDKTEIKQVSEFNINPNTYHNFLHNKVLTVQKTLDEEKDYYLSDAGLYLPSTYQADLCKLYPSLPLFYATQRHLLNSNFHTNVQNLPRLWDKLREQADYYFYCCQSIRIGKRTFIQKIRYYDRYESASQNVLPFKVDALLFLKDKRQLALKRQFDAQNGEVKYLYIVNRLPKGHYDTRHFHKLIYGEPAPTKTKKGKQVSPTPSEDGAGGTS